MKIRSGFVSNSSSSSFLVAIKKGHSLDEVISQAGIFADFAKQLVEFIDGEIKDWQSVQNIALYHAQKEWRDADKAVRSVAEGDYSWIVDWCLSISDNPDEWFFGIGGISTESDDPIELLLITDNFGMTSDFFVLESRAF